MSNASLCLSGADWYAKCPWAQTAKNMPHITTYNAAVAPGKTGSSWEFIPQVNTHYPEGYICEDMWDMTHTDYENTDFYKANPFHLDNQLPSIDGGIRPLNIVALPIYKGISYQMSYDKTLTHQKFSNKKGWWSDQLQNKDNSLLAGNARSNNVSVGQDDLTAEYPGWILGEDLTPSAESRYGNIYVCEFNRMRIKIDPANPVQTYPPNVVVNNIVPIEASLEKNDPRLFSYDCDLSKSMYSPENISDFDTNIVETEMSSDWMYFGANLRAGALEDINVLYTLKPSQYDGVYQEGMTKIQEGGRFVYWNPALGPNTFLVVDDLVDIVMARRTDLKTSHMALPSSTTTFKSQVFHIIDMKDEAEIGRTWDSTIYYNYNGFGDSSISVYVGGFNGSTAILSPGQDTYVEIVFYNNAGFDWNLKANAINATEIDSKPINANDLLYNLKHAIMLPLSYNFMNVTFEDEGLEQYISIKPSGHNIDTAPLFFDFENINVATIRDGFKGRYFYHIIVSSSLPDKYKGRLLHLNVALKKEYFDKLPGYNDPTPAAFAAIQHDYELTIPDIVIGVPYSSGPYSGGVYWTSGHASNLKLSHHVDTEHIPVMACLVTDQEIEELSQITGDPKSLITNLAFFWSNLSSNCKVVPFTNEGASGAFYNVMFDFSQYGKMFPFPNWDLENGPEIAEVKIMLMTYGAELPAGRLLVTQLTNATFNDDVGKEKNGINTVPDSVFVVGPYLLLEIDGQVLDENKFPLPNQTLTTDSTGYVTLEIMATNVGNGIAYHVDLQFDIEETLSIVNTGGYQYTVTSIPDSTFKGLRIKTDMTMPPGEPFSTTILVHFTAATPSDLSNKRDLVMMKRLFLNESHGMMDFTPVQGELSVTQNLEQAYAVPLQITTHGWNGGIWFAVIGLPLLAALTAAGIIAALLFRRRKPKAKRPQKQPSKSSTPSKGQEPPEIPKGPPPKHKVADMNYIMSGGTPRRIADGNPTAIATGDEDDIENSGSSGSGIGKKIGGFFSRFWRCCK
jgi:hypothetical protein